MANEKNRSLRPLGEADLARVRGGVLYPAVKLLDMTVGMLTASTAYEPATPEFTYQKIVWADQKKSQ